MVKSCKKQLEKEPELILFRFFSCLSRFNRNYPLPSYNGHILILQYTYITGHPSHIPSMHRNKKKTGEAIIPLLLLLCI